jgi:hypothetical protein
MLVNSKLSQHQTQDQDTFHFYPYTNLPDFHILLHRQVLPSCLSLFHLF